MKSVLTILLFFFATFINAQDTITITPDKIGLPDYRKLLTADPAVEIFKGKKDYFAVLEPRHYYSDRNHGSSDTLKISFRLTDNFTISDVKCISCGIVNVLHTVEAGRDYLTFGYAGNTVKIRATAEKEPTRLSHPARVANLMNETNSGFLRLENTFTRYAQIPGTRTNIAIMDFNFNGSLENSDLVGVSHDNYFKTADNDQTKGMGEVEYIEADGQKFRLLPKIENSLTISLLRENSPQLPDLYINDILQDEYLGFQTVSQLLEGKDHLIFFSWSEFCPTCIDDIEMLNALPSTVRVVGLTNGEITPEEATIKYKTNFQNIEETEGIRQLLNLNGQPYYVVTDSSRRIIYSGWDIIDVNKLVK